jgi:hypothetical protein
MVCRPLSYEKTLGAVLLSGMIMMTGCTYQSKDRSPDWSRHASVLENIRAVPSMEPGSAAEQEALRRFEEFYADYSVEAIRSGVRDIYAEDAWFGDPFHIVEGIDAIEHYFVVMAEPVVQCTFTVDSMQRSGNDYFARWTMRLESSAAKGEMIETIGLSHVRYNDAGKIIFQQDYWDTSAMLDRLPVVGFWTRLVKGKIEKGLEQ